MAERSRSVIPAYINQGIIDWYPISAAFKVFASGASKYLNFSTKLVSDHEPMPVSSSGVMFADRTTDLSGNGNSNPPANSIPAIGSPFTCFVWHSVQEAALVRYFPYS